MDGQTWAPDVDLTRPSIARVYDYFLGGSHNFAVDRAMAEQVLRVIPDMRELMRANRAFLRRAVRYLVGAGVNQFLDIGSGIPTVGNVHEVAQQADPAARIVYADLDPVAVAHSRAMLANVPGTAAVRGDVREPDELLAAPEVRDLIDFDRPVAVMLVAVLHFVAEAEDPAGAVAALRAAVPSGSYLAISHATYEGRGEARQVQELYQRTANEGALRSHAQIVALFGDFELVDPGLVYLPLWRPDDPAPVEHPERFANYAGLGRKP